MSFDADTLFGKIKKVEKELDILRSQSRTDFSGSGGGSGGGFGVGGSTNVTPSIHASFALNPVVHRLDEAEASPYALTGSITLRGASVIVEEGSNNASTSLEFNTINGTLNNGQILTIKPKEGKTLTLKTGGNIDITADVIVPDSEFVILQYFEDNGSKYNLLSGSSSGGLTNPMGTSLDMGVWDINNITEVRFINNATNTGTQLRIIARDTTTADGTFDRLEYEADNLGGHDFYVDKVNTTTPRLGITETSIESNVPLNMNLNHVEFQSITAPSHAVTAKRYLFQDTADDHLKIRTDTQLIDLETGSSNWSNITIDTSKDMLKYSLTNLGAVSFQDSGNVVRGSLTADSTNSSLTLNISTNPLRITNVGTEIATFSTVSGDEVNFFGDLDMNSKNIFEANSIVFDAFSTASADGKSITTQSGTKMQFVLERVSDFFTYEIGGSQKFTIGNTNIQSLLPLQMNTNSITDVTVFNMATYAGSAPTMNGNIWSDGTDIKTVSGGSERNFSLIGEFPSPVDTTLDMNDNMITNVELIGIVDTGSTSRGSMSGDATNGLVINGALTTIVDTTTTIASFSAVSGDEVNFFGDLDMNSKNIFEANSIVFDAFSTASADGKSITTQAGTKMQFVLERTSDFFTYEIGGNQRFVIGNASINAFKGISMNTNAITDVTVFNFDAYTGTAPTADGNMWLDGTDVKIVSGGVEKNISNTATQLDDLSDVLIGTPAGNTVLKYDTGTSKWVDGNILNANIDASANIDWAKINKAGSSLDDLADTLIGTPASNTVLKYVSGTGWVDGNVVNNNIDAGANIDKSKIATALTWATGDIPNLPASKITSGTLSTGVIPNLSATKITSDTIGVDRLGTGATATKFLRGDNTWQTVSAGGSTSFVGFTADDDLNMSTYDISNLDRILFDQNNGSALSSVQAGITSDNTPDMHFNLTGSTDFYRFHFGGSAVSEDTNIGTGGVTTNNIAVAHYITLNASSQTLITNGMINRNTSGDVQVYSGGSIRNMSDIGASSPTYGVQDYELPTEHNTSEFGFYNYITNSKNGMAIGQSGNSISKSVNYFVPVYVAKACTVRQLGFNNVAKATGSFSYYMALFSNRSGSSSTVNVSGDGQNYPYKKQVSGTATYQSAGNEAKYTSVYQAIDAGLYWLCLNIYYTQLSVGTHSGAQYPAIHHHDFSSANSAGYFRDDGSLYSDYFTPICCYYDGSSSIPSTAQDDMNIFLAGEVAPALFMRVT